jgi:cell division protein FtsW
MPATKKKVLERKQGAMDIPFLLLVILLMSIGLVMMYSASYASAYYTYNNSAFFFLKQAGLGAGGVVIMLIISRINYQWFRALSLPAIVLAVVLLVLTLFVGTRINGAKRWLFGFQPSEVAKIAIIMSFSSMISVYKERMKTFRYGILPFVLILGIISALLIVQPHISATILILAVGAMLMFVGGVHWGWFAAVGAAGVAGAYLVITNMAHSIARISIWLDPFSDPQGDGYQTIQSLYAIGSGGALGVGLGKSRQKHLYLPYQYNDFVFSIVCEELGFVGAIMVLLLFAALAIRGYMIALRARDRFGSLLVTGVTTLFVVQTFLNIAVVTNLIPVTGISLPFFSYGGTSLVIQLAEMGIILSVSRQTPAPKSG